jgi:hypothetical protein
VTDRHHNAPPLAERLKLDHEALQAQVAEILQANHTEGSIAGSDDAALWSIRASAVKSGLKLIEDARKKAKDQINKDGKTVEAFFREVGADLQQLSDFLVADINRFQREQITEQRRRQEEAAARERKIAATLQEKPPAPVVPVAAKDAGRIATGGAVKASANLKWVHRVTDPQAVPRQYLMVNEAAIKAAVAGGVREIPGVEIYEDIRTAIR